MKWRLFSILLAIAATFALWFDLTRFYSYRAEKQYRLGSYFEARNDWQAVLARRGDDSAARFNRGVASYRLGEFSAAHDDFARVVKSADPALRYQALFNQGNSLAWLAAQSGSGQSTKAEQLYRAALECYDEALKVRPADQDARNNRDVVAAARSALQTTPGDKKRAESGGAGSKTGDKAPAIKPPPDKAAKVEGQNGKPDSSNQEATGKSRKSMGREQAERLLNEKRGQEALPSAIKAVQGGAKSAPPAKDW